MWSVCVFVKVGQASHCYFVSFGEIFGSYFRLTQRCKRLPECRKIYLKQPMNPESSPLLIKVPQWKCASVSG